MRWLAVALLLPLGAVVIAAESTTPTGPGLCPPGTVEECETRTTYRWILFCEEAFATTTPECWWERVPDLEWVCTCEEVDDPGPAEPGTPEDEDGDDDEDGNPVPGPGD